jgi:hypothetical protein
MSTRLGEMRLSENGPIVLVETNVSEGSKGFVEVSGLPVRAEKTLKEALASIGPTAEAMLDQIREVKRTPQKVVLEFGVKFSAKGNVVIAGGEAEANCKVTLSWDNPKSDA